MGAVGLKVDGLSFAYPGSPQNVLDKLSVDIEPGEIVALLGSSGCGKSTFLRAVAGLITPQSGEVHFCGDHSNRRAGDTAFVFQDATLLPWRTVRQNVCLPFELGRRSSGDSSQGTDAARESLDRKVAGALDAVGLGAQDFAKFPRELSGGMRMRTSIARALVTDPNVLLLDEPFAALDEILRMRLNDLVLNLWQQRTRTILFVTHNIAEAIYLSHRIAILDRGRVQAIVDNSLDWPREARQRTTREFAELFGKISEQLAQVTHES